MIEIKNLTKYYKKKKAIENLSISIPDNSIFGFLGCNGAGKTTTLSIIAGLVKKDKGNIKAFEIDLDKDPEGLKKSMGVMIQEMELFGHLTARKNIEFLKKLKNSDEDIVELFKNFDLEYILDKKYKNLSHGEKRLLQIMQSFLGKPKLVILDEPISGFDPRKIIMIREFIKKKKKDTTIILSSHNLDEVDRICSHIAIIHEGKIVLSGEKKKIKKRKTLEKVFLENI